MNAHSPTGSFHKPPYPATDRRRHRRYMGQDISLDIDGKAAAVLDISVGGIRAAVGGLARGKAVSLTMSTPTQDAITVKAEVRETNGEAASLAFVSPTYALMRFVVHYLADHHGVDVHAFR